MVIMDPLDMPICQACNAQYDTSPQRCKICDDPRQYVPPTGQAWTTLREMRLNHKTRWQQDEENKTLLSCYIEPKTGIGERAMLIQTPHGNVLWDLIALLDEETISCIKSKGGLKAIVISHPHFYTTYADWAKAFDCPVYISDDDQQWLSRDAKECIEFISGPVGTQKEIIPGVTAIKVGGHFDSSIVLHWEKTLFVADAFVHVPSAYSPAPRPRGQTTYSFMWSIPNMIPMGPSKIVAIVNALEPFDFETTHGVFVTMTARGKGLKSQLLESAQIQLSSQGSVPCIEDGRLQYRSA